MVMLGENVLLKLFSFQLSLLSVELTLVWSSGYWLLVTGRPVSGAHQRSLQRSAGGGRGGMTRMTPPEGAARWPPSVPTSTCACSATLFRRQRGRSLHLKRWPPKTSRRQLRRQILTDVVVRDVGTSRPDGM